MFNYCIRITYIYVRICVYGLNGNLICLCLSLTIIYVFAGGIFILLIGYLLKKNYFIIQKKKLLWLLSFFNIFVIVIFARFGVGQNLYIYKQSLRLPSTKWTQVYSCHCSLPRSVRPLTPHLKTEGGYVFIFADFLEIFRGLDF